MFRHDTAEFHLQMFGIALSALCADVVSPMGKQRRRFAPTMQYEHFSIKILGYKVETWYICNIVTFPGQYGSALKFATLAGG